MPFKDGKLDKTPITIVSLKMQNAPAIDKYRFLVKYFPSSREKYLIYGELSIKNK